MSDKEIKISNMGTWIPQVFYDFIGRIIPGGVLIWLAGVLMLDADSVKAAFSYLPKDSGIVNSIIFLMLLALSYLLGLLLSHTVSFFGGTEWRQWKKIKQLRCQSHLPKQRKFASDMPFIYDAIQHYYPVTGARLAKLSAERSLARVFIIGFPLLSIIYAIVRHSEFREIHYWCAIGLLLLTMLPAIFFNTHLKIRSHGLMINNFRLLQMEKRLDVSKWDFLVELDETLLQGGVILSEWATFLIKDADIAFVNGAHLACIITGLAGIETHLRAEAGSSKHRLVDLIDQGGLEEGLREELHILRKYRNKWVHVADPLADETLLHSPENHEAKLEEMAKRCVVALRRTIYSNPWI